MPAALRIAGLDHQLGKAQQIIQSMLDDIQQDIQVPLPIFMDQNVSKPDHSLQASGQLSVDQPRLL